jgi:VanZ family protein
VKKIKPSFIPAIFWLIFSTVLLTLPGSSFPKEDWLSKIWFDKWVHIGMFTIMVILWCWAILKVYSGSHKLKRIFLLLAVTWLAYGIMMEFVQLYFISNRSFDVGDIAADGAGCIIGLIYSRDRYIKK